MFPCNLFHFLVIPLFWIVFTITNILQIYFCCCANIMFFYRKEKKKKIDKDKSASASPVIQLPAIDPDSSLSPHLHYWLPRHDLPRLYPTKSNHRIPHLTVKSAASPSAPILAAITMPPPFGHCQLQSTSFVPSPGL